MFLEGISVRHQTFSKYGNLNQIYKWFRSRKQRRIQSPPVVSCYRISFSHLWIQFAINVFRYSRESHRRFHPSWKGVKGSGVSLSTGVNACATQTVPRALLWYNRCSVVSGIIASESASSSTATVTSCLFFFFQLSRDWCAAVVNFLPRDRATRSTCRVFELIPKMLSTDCGPVCRVLFGAVRKCSS